MKLSVVSDIMYAIYYNGRPQDSGHKLDVEDFFQFALASSGAIIRGLYYEELQLSGDASSFVTSMVEIKQVAVVSGKMGIRTINEDMMLLPRNSGIFNIYPLLFENGLVCGIDYANAFTRIATGSEWFYDQDRIEDLGLKAFVQRGHQPVLYCDLKITQVALEGIFRGDDYDVPEYVARAIINDVLTTTLKVAGFPVDMTDDGNPNVKLVNEKIASAQTL